MTMSNVTVTANSKFFLSFILGWCFSAVKFTSTKNAKFFFLSYALILLITVISYVLQQLSEDIFFYLITVGDKNMLSFIRDKTADPYFWNLVWFIGNHAIELDNCVLKESQ